MTRARLLAAFALVAAAGVAAYVWRSREAAPRRVIVVGLDGADWQLLDRYIAQGAMPELARLVREGRSGVLQSFVPSLSPLVWTTIATGRSPLEHRILDFTRFNPETRQREPITSDERRAKAVWEMAGEAGREVAVFGLWATHPAEPVRGLMVSDRLFSFHREETSAPAGVVHPPAEEPRVVAARAEAERAVGAAELRAFLPWLTDAEYARLSGGGGGYAQPALALRRILVETRLFHRLALEWLAREKPALGFVYVQGTDTIGHTFAPYAPPRQPAISEEDFARYSAVPEAYFREVDRMLGDYRRIAEEQEAAILVVSDHGFLWGEGRPPRPDSLAQATAGLWHREQGVYVLWGDGRGADPTRGRGRVGQVAATVLALLGLPRGAGLDGPALAGVREGGETRDYGPRTAVARASADPAAAEALEKLRALGYVGGAEPAAAGAGTSGTRTAGSYNNEGLLLRAASRTEEAKRAFEEALKVDPKAASAAHNLSVMLTESDPARADALLLDAVANGLGDGPRILIAAAETHGRAGDTARARRLVDGIVERMPNDPGPRLLRGRLLLETRDCARAFADFDVARRAAPGAALAHGLAGTALLCLGRTAEGRAALERSLALDPSQERLRAQLATLRERP